VYLVEVELSADLAAVAARIRRDLAFAGERDGQVEVHPKGADLPLYHRLARAAAVLLWSRPPAASTRPTRPTRPASAGAAATRPAEAPARPAPASAGEDGSEHAGEAAGDGRVRGRGRRQSSASAGCV
jgi:hypothetical protein